VSLARNAQKEFLIGQRSRSHGYQVRCCRRFVCQ